MHDTKLTSAFPHGRKKKKKEKKKERVILNRTVEKYVERKNL